MKYFQVAPEVSKVSVYNIYDIFGLEEDDFNKVINATFVDPVTDIVHNQNPATLPYIAIEFLPGQYDQRADSAEQCIALLTGRGSAKVRSGKLIEMEGISNESLGKVKGLLINKVESHEKTSMFWSILL